MRSAPLLLLSAAALGLVSCGDSTDGGSALALFERRILPILNSPKPSSCAECHLSGVDLKDYIRKDQKETFGSGPRGTGR